MSDTSPRSQRIAQLNDRFRSNPFGRVPGLILVTQAAQSLAASDRRILIQAVQTFDDFTGDNDPYGEHDFGLIKLFGTTWFWKIDYYADSKCEWGAEHPERLSESFRVLTIMQASEY